MTLLQLTLFSSPLWAIFHLFIFFFLEAWSFLSLATVQFPFWNMFSVFSNKLVKINIPAFITSYRRKALNQIHLGMLVKATQHIVIDDPSQIPQLTYFAHLTW